MKESYNKGLAFIFEGDTEKYFYINFLEFLCNKHPGWIIREVDSDFGGTYIIEKENFKIIVCTNTVGTITQVVHSGNWFNNACADKYSSKTPWDVFLCYDTDSHEYDITKFQVGDWKALRSQITRRGIRIFDVINYPIADLPTAISIDEFKGNTWGEKYQCILTDPVNKVVLDILPKRYKPYLTNYFKQFSKEKRNSVTYFVSDMWRTYADISDVWFKNATQVIDKYHWIRQAIWAFENVRKEEQKKLSPELRKYFKRSKSLLIKRYDKLKEEQKQQVNVMLYYSVNISRAYFYKEQFLKILNNEDAESAKEAISKWIQNTENCGIPQFEKCAETMQNWYKGIINSFSTTITNGFTEGCNNKIKVLKRNAYGYQNFKRFRNRILHIFSHQQLNKEQAAA